MVQGNARLKSTEGGKSAGTGVERGRRPGALMRERRPERPRGGLGAAGTPAPPRLGVAWLAE